MKISDIKKKKKKERTKRRERKERKERKLVISSTTEFPFASLAKNPKCLTPGLDGHLFVSGITLTFTKGLLYSRHH